VSTGPGAERWLWRLGPPGGNYEPRPSCRRGEGLRWFEVDLLLVIRSARLRKERTHFEGSPSSRTRQG
jgi:hypothetical protein